MKHIIWVLFCVSLLALGGCIGQLDSSSNSTSSTGGSGGGTTAGPLPKTFNFWVFRFWDQDHTMATVPSGVSALDAYVQDYLDPSENSVPSEYGIQNMLVEMTNSMVAPWTNNPIEDGTVAGPAGPYYLDTYLILKKNSCQNAGTPDDLNVPREIMTDIYKNDNTFKTYMNSRLPDPNNLLSAVWDGPMHTAYMEAYKRLRNSGKLFPSCVYGGLGQPSVCGESNSDPLVAHVVILLVPGVRPSSGVFSAGRTYGPAGLVILNSAIYDMTNGANEIDVSLVSTPFGSSVNDAAKRDWFKRTIVFCHESFHVLQNSFILETHLISDLYNNFPTMYRTAGLSGQPNTQWTGNLQTDPWVGWLIGEFTHHRFWSLYEPGRHAEAFDTWRHQCMMSKQDDFMSAPPQDFSTQDSFAQDSLYRANWACQICWQKTVSHFYR